MGQNEGIISSEFPGGESISHLFQLLMASGSSSLVTASLPHSHCLCLHHHQLSTHIISPSATLFSFSFLPSETGSLYVTLAGLEHLGSSNPSFSFLLLSIWDRWIQLPLSYNDTVFSVGPTQVILCNIFTSRSHICKDPFPLHNIYRFQKFCNIFGYPLFSPLYSLYVFTFTNLGANLSKWTSILPLLPQALLSRGAEIRHYIWHKLSFSHDCFLPVSLLPEESC